MDIPLFAPGDDGPGDHPVDELTQRAEGVTRPAGDTWTGWTSVQLAILGQIPPRARGTDMTRKRKRLRSLMKSRRRPSKLADALTRKAYRDYNRVQTGPSVKWIPKVEAVTAALDEAEALGKKTSLSG